MQMATRNPRTRPWTRADLERLPDDGNRYEVLDGALLVTPQAAVPHQNTATKLAILLGAYCARDRVGLVVAPGALPFGKIELQPDVMVVLDPPSPLPKEWTALPRPSLVVEVLSNSTARRDVGIKRDAYLRLGIPEYWIVDGDARTITIVRGGDPDRVVSDALQWRPRASADPLEIEVATLFG